MVRGSALERTLIVVRQALAVNWDISLLIPQARKYRLDVLVEAYTQSAGFRVVLPWHD